MEQTMERTQSGNELLIAWLNNAYSMENSLIQMLENRVKGTQDFPDLQALDQQHLEETRRHAENVKQCITRLGEKPSSVKSLFGTIFGAIQAPMTGFGRDEIVQNTLADHSAERFEVASYTALIEAANQLGDAETARVCTQNMREDEAMAARLMQMLPMIVRTQVSKITGVPAGRAAAEQMVPPEAAQPGIQPEMGTGPG
jgi:ferritin-like metal-binding protein YciE